MKKLLSFIIETISWVQLFIAPVAIGGIVALSIYIANKKLLWLSIVIGTIAVITGVWYAERTRRKPGTSRYLSKILSTPDIWPDEYPDESEGKNDQRMSKN